MSYSITNKKFLLFVIDHTIKIDGNIINLKITKEANSIISNFLEKNPGPRLGKNGLNEMKSHPFFVDINFWYDKK